MNYISDTDVAWAAGFFDGEGCVIAYIQGHPKRRAKFLNTGLVAHNRDLRPLRRLQSLFGGEIFSEKSGVWKWKVSGEASERAAKAMLYHTSAKFEQLEMFIELRESVGQGVDVETRERLVSEIKSCKTQVRRLP